MKCPLILSLVLIAACYANPAPAQDVPTRVEQFAARRELELAKIDLRTYWQIEYPRQRRELDVMIELTEMELLNLEAQLREFRPFTQFSIGKPFPLTVRSLQMCIKAAELRLDDLRDEQNILIRFHSDRFRVLAWQVYDARLRIAELEGPRMPQPVDEPVRR